MTESSNAHHVAITEDGRTVAAATVSTSPARTRPPTSTSTPSQDTSQPARAASSSTPSWTEPTSTTVLICMPASRPATPNR